MPDDERDDETIFWERFFEKLQPLREAGQKVIGSVFEGEVLMMKYRGQDAVEQGEGAEEEHIV